MLIRLQRYVLFEVLKILLLAVGGVSGLILVLMCIRAIQDGLPPTLLPTVLPYYVPFVLPFSVPAGLLIATVMAFGRLTGDNEMLAIRSSGVSVRHVIWPVLLLGVVLAGLTTQLNNNLLPWCRRTVQSKQDVLIKQIKAEDIVSAARQIDLDPYQIFIGGVSAEDPTLWEHVLAVKYATGHIVRVIIAESGRIRFGPENLSAELELYNGTILERIDGEQWSQGSSRGSLRYSIDLKDAPSGAGGAGTMSFADLRAARRALQEKVGHLAMPARPRAVRRRLGAERAQLTEANINAHQARLALGEKLDTVESEIKAKWANITSLYERIQVTQAELLSRRRLLEQAKREITHVLQLRRAIPDGSARAKRVDAQIADLTAKRTRLSDAVDQLSTTVREDKAREAEELTRLSQLRVDAASLRAEKERRGGEIEERREKIDRLGKQFFVVRSQENLRDIVMQIHYRISQSVACFIFVMLGIPLGMMAGRGGIVVSFGVSFGVVIFLYYPVYTVGKHLADSGMMDPALAMWLPVLICGTLGVILTWRVSRH